MNERETALTAKLLDTKPFSFPIDSICASLDATKLIFDIGEELNYTDIFLESVPDNYKGKIISFYSKISNYLQKENLENHYLNQEWIQILSYGSRNIISRKIFPLR